MRNVAQNAELALLLEVAGTPKPGNVDRRREYDDLRFEHFLAGAVGAQEGLRMAADGEPLGGSFQRAIEGMSEQRGGNTQFGAILLQLPLVAAAGDDDRELSPEGATAVVESTTVADAAGFYRAFEAVDVAVDDPPEDMSALDVRRGADAVSALEERGLTLADIMERSADRDGVAREWVEGFERTFAAAESIGSGDPDRPVTDRAADAFLELLAAEVDTFVVTKHGRATAERATERAQAALDGEVDPEELAEEFVAEGINPGTTADTVAAALFVALERGLEI
ncbi:triphosphoribosyl-dephospho-CoA synthase [Halosimplex halophilum]|uniref:triphosphoribosyl-dephospho-CoA synthase n=1 Tax=Halosimplex halophilum TaxID=2559572 RepID=UPI00107FD2DB|nr:triphosphoribosyl-dephospho-CoA synthase [Halosimplex halophilum]